MDADGETESYLEWNHEMRAKRKKKRDREVLDKDRASVGCVIRDIEMIRDLADHAGVLPVHCLATFGNACHIVGMVCTVCRSQKLYWNRMMHSPAGKTLADANKKDNEEWVKRAHARIHLCLEGNPNAS